MYCVFQLSLVWITRFYRFAIVKKFCKTQSIKFIDIKRRSHYLNNLIVLIFLHKTAGLLYSDDFNVFSFFLIRIFGGIHIIRVHTFE